MDTPRDPWVQEQIEQYSAGNTASAAFYQQAARLLSARQLLASSSISRRRRVHSLGRLLRVSFRRLYRDGWRVSSQPPAVHEGMVMFTPTETDTNAPTVIVIGVQQQTKGE